MISCLSFRKRLNDYLENKITFDFKKEMDSHMEECLECKALYEEELGIDSMFTEALSGKSLPFESGRSQILASIDTARYKKSLGNKLYFNIKRNYKGYLSSAAVLFLIFFAGLYLRGITSNNFKPTIPPVVEEKPLYSNFPLPDSIVINTYGGKRTLTREDPSYKQILDLTEVRFVKPVGRYYKALGEEALRELEGELYVEFLYNSVASTDYKGFKEEVTKVEYSRLLMPLTGGMGGRLITGDKEKYHDGPLGDLAPSEELIKLLLADEANRGLTGLDRPSVDFSLSPELVSIYKQYAKKRDDNLLKGLEPIEVCKLYQYSREKADYETEYALYIKGENYGTPSYEEFMKDISHEKASEENTKAFLKTFRENIIDIRQEIKEDNAALHFKFKDREFMGGEISFGLVKNSKGIWKVHWMPLQ